MSNNSSFEDRLARLAEKTPTTPHAPAPRKSVPLGGLTTGMVFPFGGTAGRIVFPLCGLAALAATIFVVTGETKGVDVRKNPFDLAGSLRSNMTEAEIDKMNNDADINRAAARAPTPEAAEMVRLLLSN